MKTQPEPMEMLALRVPRSLRDRLIREAEKDKRTLSDFVRLALLRMFRQQ